jgi:hypothetical protein
VDAVNATSASEKPIKHKKWAGAGKSRITNGRDILPNVDLRSRIARRYRDLVHAIVSDQGGVANISESRMQLIRRFAAASCIAENFEAKLVAGEDIDLSEFAQLSSTLVRLTNHLGLDRVPRTVTGLITETIDGHLVEPRQSVSSPLRDRAAQAAADINAVEEEPA